LSKCDLSATTIWVHTDGGNKFSGHERSLRTEKPSEYSFGNCNILAAASGNSTVYFFVQFGELLGQSFEFTDEALLVFHLLEVLYRETDPPEPVEIRMCVSSTEKKEKYSHALSTF
jgi:hypothetical protein